MTRKAPSSDVIPSIEADAKKLRRVWLIFPGTMLLLGLVGYLVGGFDGAANGIGNGFAIGIVLTIVTFIVSINRLSKKQKAIWDKHTFQWYRETYPAHAHENGHVTCCHCGSGRIHARSIMNGTFMRSHSCNQCGAALYYSPEV